METRLYCLIYHRATFRYANHGITWNGSSARFVHGFHEYELSCFCVDKCAFDRFLIMSEDCWILYCSFAFYVSLSAVSGMQTQEIKVS